jgi:hypothetical protein
MGEYIRSAYVGEVSQYVFGRQLVELVQELGFPEPRFKGRPVDSDIPGVDRWEIRTLMLADPTAPHFEAVDSTGIYPTWREGVDIAMMELLSRLCHTYGDYLDADSTFRDFGKRRENGVSTKTAGNRLNISTAEKHFEDTEFHANNLAQRVHIEMTFADHARAVIHVQNQELQAQDTLIGHMEEYVHELQVQNVEKDAMIAALQAQLNPPPPPPGDDPPPPPPPGDDPPPPAPANDGEDEDAGVEADQAQEEEEEEEPEEMIHYISSEEEDTLARNTLAMKRRRMTARQYVNLFPQ